MSLTQIYNAPKRNKGSIKGVQKVHRKERKRI